jgi:enoyl-CoA hydratase/carnithine racemase
MAQVYQPGDRLRAMAEVETSLDGSVLTITLNRPDSYNALTTSMHAALHAALGEAASEDVRAVVITGAGKGFCAGQDLTEFRSLDHDVGEHLE